MNLSDIILAAIKNLNIKINNRQSVAQAIEAISEKCSIVDFGEESKYTRKAHIWDFVLELRKQGKFGVTETGDIIETTSIEDTKKYIIENAKEGVVLNTAELYNKFDSRQIYLLISSDVVEIEKYAEACGSELNKQEQKEVVELKKYSIRDMFNFNEPSDRKKAGLEMTLK